MRSFAMSVFAARKPQRGQHLCRQSLELTAGQIVIATMF